MIAKAQGLPSLHIIIYSRDKSAATRSDSHFTVPVHCNECGMVCLFRAGIRGRWHNLRRLRRPRRLRRLRRLRCMRRLQHLRSLRSCNG